ncbi:50S ribosomal protein L11 methyltransferase [Desulfurobacterium atlanticum]|uniref:Ribosomal protein L11 methyltransferase n=1 Tax=Desulfurobacterium atlanticum TaxID=240169 RepID=A0A238XNP0_9BACT|nr:50S ribosomal protein L11 methyltransferase [Desulfurobacterium atlanticum]SNR60151.1 ribosomal protein L11 methyltransferase [Desulfurobacterium atlanticum]
MERYYLVFDFAIPFQMRDIADGMFFEAGCKGVEDLKEENGIYYVRVYFDGNADFHPEETPLKEYLIGSFRIEEQDWNENWKEHFKPVEIGKSIVVVPSWLKEEFNPEDRIPIYIYPGQTFGTGSHESTKLMMKLMEEYVFPDCSFLDVGSGSGILSILAKKLGAGKVVACDIQKEAKDELELNSLINGVSGVEFVHGSVDRVKGQFDIVVANIEKHLLLPIFPEIVRKVSQTLLISGILESQESDMVKEIEKHGFTVEKVERENGWIAVAARK